jgi:serine/threonine-protein kinase
MRAEDLFTRTIAGKYRVEAFLGAGAMGTVYRARHLELDKIVAVKVMKRAFERDASLVERFHREARAASLFDHPNSIRMLDFGREPNGLLYLVMEYVAGRDLCRVLAEEKTLPAARIVDILAQVLAAVAVAHEMGVLHRDLKPENILILHTTGDDDREQDVVKVCDFGIAKIIAPTANEPVRRRRQAVTAGFIVGTPEYMAPEQVLGGKVDARCDIYSMGVILYQLLAGRLPFEGDDSIGVAMKRIAEDPPPPSTYRPDVDPRLEAICLKAMNRIPAGRFQTAREMRTALQAARDSVELLGPPRVRETVGSIEQSPTLEPPAAPPIAPTAPLSEPMNDTVAETVRATPSDAVNTTSTGRERRWRTLAFPALLLSAVGLVAWARHAGAPSPPTVVEPPRVPDPVLPKAPLPVAAPATVTESSDADAPNQAPSPAPLSNARTQRSVQTGITSAHEAMPSSVGTEPAPAEPLPPIPVAVPPIIAPPPAAVVSAPSARLPAVDVRTARVTIGGTSQVIGTTVASIRKVLVPLESKLSDCYRGALLSMGTPAAAAVESVAGLHLETDGDGVIVDARVDGPLAGVVGPCAFQIVRGKRIPNVDTGRASVDVSLALHPR